MNHVVKLLALAAAAAAVSISAFAASEALAGRDAAAQSVTREIPWEGAESLTVDVPANVRFIQADGPGKVVVTGARRSVENFGVAGGHLSDSRWHTGKPLDIVVMAPKITHFSIKGTDTLVIEGFDQPFLFIATVGRAEVKAAGRAGRVELQLQGSGWVDLSELHADEADVTLTGSRHVLLAAREKARVSGNGSVVLVTKPKGLELELGESGRVFTLNQAASLDRPSNPIDDAALDPEVK